MPLPMTSAYMAISGFPGLPWNPAAELSALGLPHRALPKPTDRRAFTGETVQCEAIPPDVLAAIIQAAIEAS